MEADDYTQIEAHRCSDTRTTIEIQISDFEIGDRLMNFMVPLKTTTTRWFERGERKNKQRRRLESLREGWSENPPESGDTNERHSQRGKKQSK